MLLILTIEKEVIHIKRIEVGNIIRHHRKKKDYTLKELAEITDLSYGFLGDIERDRSRPSYENLFKLMYALEIPNNEFFDDH